MNSLPLDREDALGQLSAPRTAFHRNLTRLNPFLEAFLQTQGVLNQDFHNTLVETREFIHNQAVFNLTLSDVLTGVLTETREFIHSQTILNQSLLTSISQSSSTPTRDGFDCIRLLKQVEDLVLDQSPNRDGNNRTLEEYRGRLDEPLRLLADEPTLRERYGDALRPFQGKQLRERANRYLELQQLIMDILRYFTQTKKNDDVDPDNSPQGA
ncbi:hypothetical protein [Candidatus Cyanaurora vandensis]|uniref:hypothetical protein n=1 Tax=Candidatus Cyanaurora vandensis TaxID=2714958 RepID=UPI002580C212|nr:hypothetical protein [Candidatus Cyanaurora vandensis]